MDEELLEKAKVRLREALEDTQQQGKEAAHQIGGLLQFGAKKLKDAADAASAAIREDINGRP